MCNCALFKHTHCIYLAFEDLKEATCMCHPSDVDMIWKSECILNSLLICNLRYKSESNILLSEIRDLSLYSALGIHLYS